MRNATARVQDILEAIEQIELELPISLEDLRADPKVQVWFVHHLRIIGEAARSLSDETRAEMPDIPWRQYVGMRHILIHEYFQVDCDRVFAAVGGELQALKRAVQEWLAMR